MNIYLIYVERKTSYFIQQLDLINKQIMHDYVPLKTLTENRCLTEKILIPHACE